MGSPEITDTTCGVFRDLPGDAVTPDAIHRFVVGEDTSLRTLAPAEASAELGDPFATLLLLAGVFPRTAGDVLSAFERAADGGGESLGAPSFFLLGEGSQIPFGPETESVGRNLRFLVALGAGPEGPDVLISSFHPDEADVELMAWDRRAGGFNYYRTVGGSTGWVFAGNSRHALTQGTEGKGPFESHTSGNFLMKELRAPWINWHSPDANILATVFAPDDALRSHPWFTGKEPQGAFKCELSVARPSIERWTRARFAALQAEGTVGRPGRILQQLLETPTVNLITSHTEARVAGTTATVDLPQTFFVDSEALTEILGLQAPPPFSVAGAIYATALETFEVKLSDDNGFDQPGDTHFCFVVPERAFEDEAVLRQAIASGLLSERLAACLLMVDFANPIFSARRAGLMAHVPAGATLENGRSGFSQQMAEAILAAADASPADSPEGEFAARWAAGDGWREASNGLLAAYYAAVEQQLGTQEGFDAYFRLAESRREHVRGSSRFLKMPIFESELLFARSNVPDGERRMLADGTVAGA